MRTIALLSLIALFCLPVLANQEDEAVLPFAYVTESEGDYDLSVMDAASGEILYEITSEYDDCNGGISANGWLSYYQRTPPSSYVSHRFLMDLSTGESLPLSPENRAYAGGVSEQNRIAYFDYEQQMLHLYDISHQHHLLTVNSSIWRFVDDVLFYVLVDEESIYFYRWDDNGLLMKTFERMASDWFAVTMSPNGQFLSVKYSFSGSGDSPDTSSLYLIDTVNDSIQETGQAQFNSPFSWRENVPASFVYFSEVGDLILYDALSQEASYLLERNYPRIRSLYWSENGQFLAYVEAHEGGTYAPWVYIYLIDMSTRERFRLEIESENTNFVDMIHSWEGDIQWVSSNQLVFTYARSQAPNEIEYNNLSELYLYNVETREVTRLTNTPDKQELFGCELG